MDPSSLEDDVDSLSHASPSSFSPPPAPPSSLLTVGGGVLEGAFALDPDPAANSDTPASVEWTPRERSHSVTSTSTASAGGLATGVTTPSPSVLSSTPLGVSSRALLPTQRAALLRLATAPTPPPLPPGRPALRLRAPSVGGSASASPPSVRSGLSAPAPSPSAASSASNLLSSLLRRATEGIDALRAEPSEREKADRARAKAAARAEKDRLRTLEKWRGILDRWDEDRPSDAALLTRAWSKGGIPPSCRSELWQRAVGNELHLTPELFAMMQRRAAAVGRLVEAREAKEIADAKEAAQRIEAEKIAAAAAAADLATNTSPSPSSDDDASSAAASPAAAAAADSPAPALPSFDSAGSTLLWDDESLSCQSSFLVLRKDIPRTFADLAFFHSPESEYAQALRAVLEAYACYRPDLGFVQGQSYLAATLLLHLDADAYAAFVALANLLHQPLYFGLFRMEPRALATLFHAFSGALEKHAPAVSRHFIELDVRPEMYIIEWLLTAFSRSMPIELVARLWDGWLLSGAGHRAGAGTPFLFQCAIGLLRFLERYADLTANEQDFEATLDLLMRPPQSLLTAHIDDVLECVREVKIDQKEIDERMAAASKHADKQEQ